MNGSISEPPSIVCSRDVNPDPMLRTIKEAAELLSVSRKTVERARDVYRRSNRTAARWRLIWKKTLIRQVRLTAVLAGKW